MPKLANILLLLCVSLSVQAQRIPPSTIDLNASYCAAYLQDSVNFFASIANDTSIDEDLRKSINKDLFKAEINLKRIQNYLLPRSKGLMVDGLIVAYNQHAQDAQNYNACIIKCPKNLEGLACARSCSEIVGLVNKGNQCNDLSWMPY